MLNYKIGNDDKIGNDFGMYRTAPFSNPRLSNHMIDVPATEQSDTPGFEYQSYPGF